jgi:hypothetical protein
MGKIHKDMLYEVEFKIDVRHVSRTNWDCVGAAVTINCVVIAADPARR